MVVIRLSRGGAKKRPFYHIVVADKQRSRDGRYIKKIGYFEPLAKGNAVRLSLDLVEAQAWISKGAQPSDRVKNLIKQQQAAQTATAA